MKNVMKVSLFLVAFIAFSLSANAQKYGYVDTQDILMDIPEFKQLDPQLEQLKKVLTKKGQEMVEDLQRTTQEAQAQLEAGTMSPVQQEAKQKELEQKQMEIYAFEQKMQEQLLEKRNKLLEPILSKINNAIKSVATEQGYTMLFNGSPAAGVLLYADEGVNVTSAVRSKLGL